MGWRRRGREDGPSLLESQSSLKGNTPFPFILRGLWGVMMVSVDVKNDIFLGGQECPGLGSNPLDGPQGCRRNEVSSSSVTRDGWRVLGPTIPCHGGTLTSVTISHDMRSPVIGD